MVNNKEDTLNKAGTVLHNKDMVHLNNLMDNKVDTHNKVVMANNKEDTHNKEDTRLLIN